MRLGRVEPHKAVCSKAGNSILYSKSHIVQHAWIGLSCIACVLSSAHAEEWPQWGRTSAHNMVSNETDLPEAFEVGGSDLDMAKTKNVKWAARLGTHVYGNPVVTGGRVFVGTNDASLKDDRFGSTRGGMIVCLAQDTGKVLWTLPIPRFRTNLKGFNFDDGNLGVCSSPTVDEGRVYVVSSRGEVLCLDAEGQANGNEGPFQDERRFMADSHVPNIALRPTDGDILWCFDMVKDLPCWPQDATSSSALILGDFVYVGTSNGVDKSHINVPYPDAPTLIVLDKSTGRLVARDDEKIGRTLFHGQWSSPTLGVVQGKTQVIYGAGDAFCYAFEPLTERPPKGQIATLKRIWRCDCTPPEYKSKPYQRKLYRDWNSNFFGQGPSEIIGTPVFDEDRVYVTVGQDTMHGRGQGCVTCIDATGRGDITPRWQNTQVDRTLCTVAVADGLVYVGDYSGRVHCLDADTGKRYWVHDTESPLWSSTVLADGKLYFGTEKRDFWILQAGKETRVINRIRLPQRMYSSVVVAGGTLYFATERHLYAVESGAVNVQDEVKPQ